MNQSFDRAQLKLAARAAMRQARPRVWLVTLILHLVTGAVSGILSALFLSSWLVRFSSNIGYLLNDNISPDKAMWLFFGDAPLATLSLICLFALLTGCFSYIMNYGYTAYSLKVWRHQPAGPGDLFSMFPRALKAIGASLMVGLFTFLWSLLITVPLGILSGLIGYGAGSSELLELLSSILSFAGSIFAIIITMRYAMTPYWIISDPSCGVMEAIRRSKTSMRGNIGKYFAFHLSFIGWYLLIALIAVVTTIIGIVIAVAQYGNAFLFSADAILAVVLFTYLGLGIGLLLTIPLQLFLTGYTSVASMGFFDLLAGASPASMAPAPSPGPYYQVTPNQSNTPPPVAPPPPGTDEDNWNF